ncbi:MAG: 23S rRNA pseudouridine2605 synthase [Gammaproteobacteria bacterium]|jgi:23S rRNA pseudouridine2605 synthase
MTKDKKDSKPSSAPAGASTGERIAKVLARAGVASRRDVERMIEAGRVYMNGSKVERAAINVTADDAITVDGKPVGEPDAPRLWLYHKPAGLVTSDRDEKGRKTIYDEMPDDLPRVLAIGRLDINSEGLLLLTNDGGIKRKLELPSTGWLRRYRVRVNGRPSEDTFAPLRNGVIVDGEKYQAMQVTIDRQQGANAWLTVGLREGKNREIRRAMQDVGLSVNRLIRVSYGPFQLGEIKPGEVDEIRRKIMRDQLGLDAGAADEPAKPTTVKRGAKGERKEPISRKPSEQGRTRNMARSEADRKANASANAGPVGRGKGATKTFGKQHGRPDKYEDDFLEGRSDGKKFGKPTGRPTGKPGGRPTGKPMGKPAGKPGGKPFGRPSGPSASKPAGRPTGKPSGKPRGPNKR